MANLFKKLWSNEDGNIGVLGVIGGSTVLAASALAIEANMLFGSQTSLQSALDAATLAAGAVDPSLQNTTAREVFDLAIGDVPITFADDGVEITRQGDFIVGTAEGTIDSLFGGVLVPETVTVRVSSVVGFTREVGAETAGAPACIITLGDNDGLTVQGGDLLAPSCEVHIHGKATYNSGEIDTARICIARNEFGTNNGRLPESEFETNCDVAQDPYAERNLVTQSSGCDFHNFNLDNQDSVTFSPGVYCNGVNVNSNGPDIHFLPGTYFIKQGWNVNDGAWTGDGVTFIFEGNGNIQFNSGFDGLDMSAPKEGDYEGLFLVDTNNTNQYQINNGNKLNINGAIYMPKRRFVYNSGSETTTGSNIGDSFNFVVRDMHINSGSTLRVEPGEFTPRASGSGQGSGVDNGDGVDAERVASSDGIPFLAE